MKRLFGDRQLWACILVTACIVVPRAMLISHAHSMYVDDEHHLDQGLTWLERRPHPVTYYDPPLGKAILAVPLYFAGIETKTVTIRAGNIPPRTQRSVIYEQHLSPETIRLILGAWKALLFIPGVAVVFAWCRQLYGLKSAWLAAGLFLVDPTITAHAAVPALDVIAMEAVILASFLIWRYFDQPAPGRLLAAGVATAAAVLIKHTLIFLPAGIVVLAVLHWFVRPWWNGRPVRELLPLVRPSFNALAAGALIVLGSMWALLLFDVSRPADQKGLMEVEYEPGLSVKDDLLMPVLSSRVPMGLYVGSLVGAFEHAGEGQSTYLCGERRVHGWWYYFPAVALYKVPIGIWLVILVAAASYLLVRPKWDEVFVVVPLAACAALIMSSGINVGFRHALPTYGLMLILASRAGHAAGAGRLTVSWLGVAAAGIHGLTYHPDYITYINLPWKRPYLAISDSNVDWGQSLRQLDRWLTENPMPGRTIWFDPFNQMDDPGLDHYVRGRARVLCLADRAPAEGILILSPCRLTGIYYVDEKYAHLRDVEPSDVIGHCLLVYDLDEPKRGG